MNSVAAQKNKRLAITLLSVAGGMLALAYISVPLYDLFCKVTGFGGTTQTAKELPKNVLARTMTVRFNTDVSSDLPWDFKAPEKSVELKVGEGRFVSYSVHNNSNASTHGVAVYNVLPERAGLYFNKIQCFCFEDQPLAAGASAEMPVQFFIDPAIADDPQMEGVKTITLSYTFFASKSPRLAEAQKKFDTEQQRLLDEAKATP